jgi:hypothetical protein
MEHHAGLRFVRQLDVVEHTLELAVTLRDTGEAMIRLEAVRDSSGVYSVNAYSMEEVEVRGRSAAQVTRSWVTYGLPLVAQPSAQAALNQALEALSRHCTEPSAGQEALCPQQTVRLVA